MVKRYYENNWSLWQSEDPSVWYRWQFQYSNNINIRNIKNGFCLSSRIEQKNNVWVYNLYTKNSGINYIRLEDPVLWTWTEWPVYLVNRNTQAKTLIWKLQYPSVFNRSNFITIFNEKVWAWYSWSWLYTFNPVAWVWSISPIAPVSRTDWLWATHYMWWITCHLNYANTMLLFWCWKELRRYVPVAQEWLPIWWKRIREFEWWNSIQKITQEWNYIKLYVWTRTWDIKIHYLKWTFDVEDTWLVQTINIKNQIISDVVSDWIKDYLLSTDYWDLDTNYLWELSGYNKTLIMETQLSSWSIEIIDRFNKSWKWSLAESNWVIYAYMDDWVRSFKKENWIWSWILEWSVDWTNNNILFIDWETIYASWDNWINGIEYRMSLESTPETFEDTWYLIWRVFDWWWADSKKNIKLMVNYRLNNNSSSPWFMKIYLRFNKSQRDLSDFKLIRTIDDVDRVFDTIERISDTDFNKQRNFIEYQIILYSWFDHTTTPIFYNFDYYMTTWEDLSKEQIEEIESWNIEEVDNSEEIPVEEKTQWLNELVDNSWMFDIQDFCIENKKTFYNRNNWNVMVWKNWRSVEIVPTDIGIKRLVADETKSWTGTVIYATTFANQFNFSAISSNSNISSIENNINKINILKDGFYEIWFNFWAELISNIEWIEIWINTTVPWVNLFHKEYWSRTWIEIDATWSCSWSCGEWSCSWSCSTHTTIYLDNLAFTRRFIWNSRLDHVSLSKWDIVELIVTIMYEPTFTGKIKLLKNYTSWYIKYLKPNL